MIALGCDHGGFELKEIIRQRLLDAGYEVEDFGCYDPNPVEYPEVALKVAHAVADNPEKYAFGMLFCGTGIGVSIAANKVHGIRAALCTDCFSARMAKEHNNANIIAMGGRTVGHELAWEMTCVFLHAEYQSGIHAPRVKILSEL